MATLTKGRKEGDSVSQRSFESQIIAVLTVLVLILSGLQFSHSAQESTYQAPPLVARGNLAEDEQSTIALFNQASPSVVYITTSQLKTDLFHLNVSRIPQGTGSGFVWNDRGYLVTNFHVVSNADSVEVTLSDRSRWPAKVVGIEPDKDLAVLKVEAPPDRLLPITLGTSQDLQVGQKVLAIGNPFGLDHTLTTGVISGLGREIESLTRRPIFGAIQTDAAINPGNSGGPLLDSAGRLIGINTAIYSPSGAYAGIGFAVPVDTVTRLIPQLIKDGRAKRPGLGISMADDSLVRSLGKSGVLVLSVSPTAPAAGILHPTTRDPFGRLNLGDLIVALNGEPIRTSDDLFRLLEPHQVGEEVRIKVERDGQTQTVTLPLVDLGAR